MAFGSAGLAAVENAAAAAQLSHDRARRVRDALGYRIPPQLETWLLEIESAQDRIRYTYLPEARQELSTAYQERIGQKR